MSRDAGFDVADRATRTLYDPLLVKAYRRGGLAAVVAWDAVCDASWAAGHRVTFEDAVLPLPYDLGDLAALQEAMGDLLEPTGLIRLGSWEGWFGAAESRRASSRERQARFRAGTKRGGDVRATLGNNHETLPNRQETVPAVRPAGSPAVRPVVSQTDRNVRSLDEIGVARPAPILGFHPVPKPAGKKR